MFHCQFGDEKCIGNKIHACAIKYVNDPHQLADFLHDTTDIEREEVEELAEIAEEVTAFQLLPITDIDIGLVYVLIICFFLNPLKQIIGHKQDL